MVTDIGRFIKKARTGLKGDPLEKLCFVCKAPFLNAFFNKGKKETLKNIGLSNYKGGCGCNGK